VFELQCLQPRSSASTQDSTEPQTGWKGLATCEELEPLKPHVKNATRRIIDRDSLDVVYTVREQRAR
jgi:hypothetical protein